jgi:hypothetical protein
MFSKSVILNTNGGIVAYDNSRLFYFNMYFI